MRQAGIRWIVTTAAIALVVALVPTYTQAQNDADQLGACHCLCASSSAKPSCIVTAPGGVSSSRKATLHCSSRSLL